jgi:hypothetical protein
LLSLVQWLAGSSVSPAGDGESTCTPPPRRRVRLTLTVSQILICACTDATDTISKATMTNFILLWWCCSTSATAAFCGVGAEQLTGRDVVRVYVKGYRCVHNHWWIRHFQGTHSHCMVTSVGRDLRTALLSEFGGAAAKSHKRCTCASHFANARGDESVKRMSYPAARGKP